jgi:hypothetical protein
MVNKFCCKNIFIVTHITQVRWMSKRCQFRTLVLSFGCQLEILGTSQQPKRRSNGCPFFNFCPP